MVQLGVEPLAEGDVVREGVVLDPGLLGHVGHAPSHVGHTPRALHVAQQGRQQGGLAAPNLVVISNKSASDQEKAHPTW